RDEASRRSNRHETRSRCNDPRERCPEAGLETRASLMLRREDPGSEITRNRSDLESGGCHTGDLDHRVGLTVAIAAAHVLTPPEFLDDNLLRLELVDDLADDLGSLDRGGADGRTAVPARDQVDLGEDLFIARLPIPTVHLNPVALLNSELMAAVLNDCIHPSLAPRRVRPCDFDLIWCVASPGPISQLQTAFCS